MNLNGWEIEMILKESHIDRSPSYGDRPNQLQGSITFTDNLSEHKIALSPLEINNMIKAIADTVAARAIVSVAAIPEAAISAQEENKLLVNNGEISLPCIAPSDGIPF